MGTLTDKSGVHGVQRDCTTSSSEFLFSRHQEPDLHQIKAHRLRGVEADLTAAEADWYIRAAWPTSVEIRPQKLTPRLL